MEAGRAVTLQNARAGGDIIAVGGDYVAAREPVAKAIHQLPSPPRSFTDRIDELDELVGSLERDGVTIFGLQGMGGVGKTALALKLAERLTPRYSDGQFYLDLKGTSGKPLSATDAMAHIARAYYPTNKLPEKEPELGALYRSVLHDQRALLLMDNAASRAQVESLIPPACCVLLITSRERFAMEGLFVKHLVTLTPEHARELLLKIAPRIGEQADAIAALCGYLPLALRLAASALAEHIDLSPAAYVLRLTDAHRRLELIDASLILSYRVLKPKMRKLWRALGVFHGTFDVMAAKEIWDVGLDSAREALSYLLAHSLLEWDRATSRYRLHDLARVFVDARLSETERAAAEQRYAAHYETVLRDANERYLKGGETLREALRLFDTEWSNIQVGQAWAALHSPEDDEAAALCSAYRDAGGYLLDLRQHPAQQIEWREAALSAARRLGLRHAEGMHLRSLGNSFEAMEEARRAIELFEESLFILREVGDRRGEGQTLNNIGSAYYRVGELQRAIECYKEALPILRETGDRRVEGYVLNSLGVVYRDVGDSGAIDLAEESLGVAREIEDRQLEAVALSSIGFSYLYKGDPGQAIEFLEQTLAIDREIGDLRGEAMALNSLGNAYLALNQPQRALELYEKSLAVARETANRRGEGRTLWNIGLALYQLGNREQAVANAEAALEIYKQIGIPDADRVQQRLNEWRNEIVSP